MRPRTKPGTEQANTVCPCDRAARRWLEKRPMEIAGTTSSAARDQRQGPDKSAPPAARPMPTATSRRKLLRIVAILFCIVAIAGAGGWYWWQQQLHALPAWITQANGRLEAEQVEIATKYPGRVAVVLAKEGDMVDAGQVVARMDTAELEAQLHSAEAKVRQAEFEQAMVEAVIVQRDSERTWAKQELDRAATLNRQGWSTGEQLDQRRNQMRSAQATYDAALAALDAVKAQIIAGQAEVARIKSQISDSVLVAPIRGHPVQAVAARGSPARGRPRVHAARPQRHLHDDLRAGARCRPACARRRGTSNAGSRSRLRLPGQSDIRRHRGA